MNMEGHGCISVVALAKSLVVKVLKHRVSNSLVCLKR